MQGDSQTALHTSRDSRPVPDPTVLTDQLVTKATQGLREILETRIKGIEAQLDLIQIDIRNRPIDIERSISHLEALHDQKFATVAEQFAGVQKQFGERDARAREAALANTTAVNAALQAQKEAAGESAKSFSLSIDKSERATLEQITQQRSQIQSSTTNLDGKIDDLKERVTRIEGAAVGIVAAKTETVQTHTISTQNLGLMIGVAGFLVAIVALAERFVR